MNWIGILIFPIASVLLSAFFCGIINFLRKNFLIKITYKANNSFFNISFIGNDKNIKKILKRKISKHIWIIQKTGSLVPEEVFVKNLMYEDSGIDDYYGYRIIKYLKDDKFLNNLYDKEL